MSEMPSSGTSIQKSQDEAEESSVPVSTIGGEDESDAPVDQEIDLQDEDEAAGADPDGGAVDEKQRDALKSDDNNAGNDGDNDRDDGNNGGIDDNDDDYDDDDDDDDDDDEGDEELSIEQGQGPNESAKAKAKATAIATHPGGDTAGDATTTRNEESRSNPSQMRDKDLGDVVKKKLTIAKGLAREVMQDSRFMVRKLRVKYGDRNYSYTDNLPSECLPPESIELTNLIAEFSNAYDKYSVLLAKMSAFYKSQRSTEETELAMANVMVDIGMHQQGVSGQGIHAYGIVHRRISKKRSEVFSQADAYILSPLRSLLEIAMADADETLKEYKRLRNHCGLQMMRMKHWSEMGFTSEKASSRQKLKYDNANTMLSFYMQKLNTLSEVTETKLRMVESKRHVDIAKIMVHHIECTLALHETAHELLEKACEHNDKIRDDGEKQSMKNIIVGESSAEGSGTK